MGKNKPFFVAYHDIGFLLDWGGLNLFSYPQAFAGDIIGIYRLPEMPKVGDILTFTDMAIYSMVKNNTFNGMPLPDIVLEKDRKSENRFEVVKSFGYDDFKERLS